MCISEPALVVAVEGDVATVNTERGAIDVSLAPMLAAGEEVGPGDFVLVALGLAVARLDAADADVLFNRARLIEVEP